MLAVAPAEADGLPGLVDSITPEILAEWMKIPPYVEWPSTLLMPAFEIGAGYSLGGVLDGAGVAGALAPGAADLSGVGPVAAGGPGISLATHDAFVGVGAGGTDKQYLGWRADAEPSTVILDRPFLFLVYEEESGAILLMGSLSDPSSAG